MVIILPTHKKADDRNCSNYRGISLEHIFTFRQITAKILFNSCFPMSLIYLISVSSNVMCSLVKLVGSVLSFECSSTMVCFIQVIPQNILSISQERLLYLLIAHPFCFWFGLTDMIFVFCSLLLPYKIVLLFSSLSWPKTSQVCCLAFFNCYFGFLTQQFSCVSSDIFDKYFFHYFLHEKIILHACIYACNVCIYVRIVHGCMILGKQVLVEIAESGGGICLNVSSQHKYKSLAVSWDWWNDIVAYLHSTNASLFLYTETGGGML